ncbi:MAG: MerR family transcriptional regulator [Gammaproteobacteria bacterium]
MRQKIGAVARALGISAKTIRYYEEIGLVPPPGRESSGWLSAGQRIYEENEMERLRFVKAARQLDFSIEDIRQLLVGYESGPPCGCGARPLLKTLIERKLNEIREAIEALKALHAEMQSLHARTLALEHKTPAELMESGPPKLRDAIFGRPEKPGSGEPPKR